MRALLCLAAGGMGLWRLVATGVLSDRQALGLCLVCLAVALALMVWMEIHH